MDARSTSNTGGNSVTPIRVATNTAGPPHSSPAPTVHPRHHAKQQTLYVTGGANLLTPIRTSTNDPGAPIVVGVSTSAIGFAVVG